tara:strand:- start:128 stop:1015 length:888 start_codon:yes stop_codon:yes gene_type:complete
MAFYAVAKGYNTGIFLNWNECSNSVKGFKGAVYKKFDTKQEAENFISSVNKTKIQSNNDVDYFVYTDGACSNNGKLNSLAGIGIFFGIDDNRNVSEKLQGKHTNNTAELIAIIKTYYIIKKDIINNKNITIVSDSEYAISCATYYGEKCHKNDYLCKKNTEITNKNYVKEIYELFKDLKNVNFLHVKAHTTNNDIHSIGNYYADKLANLAIGLDNCPYNKNDKPINIIDNADCSDKTDKTIKSIKTDETIKSDKTDKTIKSNKTIKTDIVEIKNDIKEIKINIMKINKLLLKDRK